MSEKKIPYIKDTLVSISDAIQSSEACYNIRDERLNSHILKVRQLLYLIKK